MTDKESNPAVAVRWVSAAAAAASVAVADLVLVGWALDIPALKRVLPHLPSMKANTALCFLLAGISLWLARTRPNNAGLKLRSRLSRAAAAAVLLLALATYGEYVFGWDLGIDQLLFQEEPGALQTLSPGRMAPQTALIFLLLGCGLLGLDFKRKGAQLAAQFCTLTGCMLTYAEVLAFSNAFVVAGSLRSLTTIALPTALTSFVLGLGILAARPEREPVAVFTRGFARPMSRLLWAAVLVPGALGWLALRGEREGFYGLEVQVTILIAALTPITLAFIYWAARSLDSLDAERSRAEDAVRAERQLFRDLVDRLPAYLILLSPDYRVPFVNRFFRERFGESGGRRCYEYLFNRTEPCEICETFSALRTGQPHRWKWTGPDGRNYDIYDFPFQDTQGSQLIMEVGLDETDQLLAREALRASEERFALAVRGSMDGIWDWDLATDAVFYSPRFKELLGYEEHEITDSFSEFESRLHPLDHERTMQAVRRHLEDRVPCDIECCLRHKSGDYRWFRARGQAIWDESGRATRMAGSLGDITQQKQASQYARSLLEASLDPMVTISLEGKITDVNEATVKVTGVAREELIGTDFSNYFTAPEKAREGYERVFARAYVTDYPLTIRHVSGQLTNVIYNASVYHDVKGNVLGAFAAARDVTARRAAEEAMQKMTAELERRVEERTAELHAINQELEAFTYSVSHDLRAPLRHISGFSKFLSEEYGPQLDANAQRYLERIQEGTCNMGRLVDDLLNLGRVGRQGVRLQATGLNSLLDEVLADIRPETGERQVEWKIGRLPFLECDPALMKLVLQNLVSNALKFTRPREQAVIEVGQFSSQGQTVVFVRDNGVGFSMKYADKLFGVFQRLHRPEDFEGTGVGLATVQRIIHKHGGRVWAEAELDKGATFYFTAGASEQGSDSNNNDKLQTTMAVKS